MRYVMIPARRASTRLPNKALLPIHGTPMVLWTARRASAFAQTVGAKVVVASDDKEIIALCQNAGFDACMTPSCQSGTDRLASLADMLLLHDDDVVLNVQGDEPMLPIALMAQTMDLLENSNADVATLRTVCDDGDIDNPNVVKVVVDDHAQALYFSRAGIPFDRDGVGVVRYRHVGLYAYRVRALRAFAKLPINTLERTENLEQLRFLGANFSIATALAQCDLPHGVDTHADWQAMCALDYQTFSKL